MHKDILAIVQDIGPWHGDVYKLAALVAAKQREIDEAEFRPAEE